MKIGLVSINVGEFSDPEKLVPFVQEAEALGFESVWTVEHVFVPKQYESVYPYAPSGRLRFSDGEPLLDPLIALTYIAASTKRLRLGTGVNILPQVSPLYFAKQTACIDHLSDGRLMLGLGVGWLREEFEAIGVPFENRGQRADEYLQALKQAWSGEEVDFKGEYINWQGFRIVPPPKQRPHIPVIIGGITPRAIRRVAEHGDGWYVIHNGPDQLRSHFSVLDAALARVGRDKAGLDISSYWNYHKEGLDSVALYRDLGVKRLLINVAALRMGDPHTAIKRFADEVLSKLD